MTDQYLHLDANFVKAEIGRLIEAYPELAEDESLRADTIEGETNAFRVIERALLERQEAEMIAGAIKAREIDLAARRGRYERKSDAMRSLIRNVMKAAGLPKVQLTEASVSLTKPVMSVGIASLDDLPQGYFKVRREADKTAIREALASGQEVPGAFMVLGSEGLRIQTK
jgi:hypothetical protein